MTLIKLIKKREEMKKELLEINKLIKEKIHTRKPEERE